MHHPGVFGLFQHCFLLKKEPSQSDAVGFEILTHLIKRRMGSLMSLTLLLQPFYSLRMSKTILLATLATGMRTKLRALDTGALAFTVSVTFLTSYVVSKAIVPYLRHFFSQWNTVPMVLTFGGHMAALRFVERYIDDAADATNTLGILETMTCTDKHILKVVVEAGGIETAIKALKKHSEECEGVACNGCGLLRNICGFSYEYDHKVLECGGINALVQAMRHWPDNEQVQTNASTALDRLASSTDVAIQMKIIDVGGLIALAQARTKHQNDDRVRFPANHALVELVQQK